MIEIIIFIYGLIIGSFLNVVILRLEEWETILRGRSHCPECKTTLAWYDLVPVMSFVTLGGKCRYCKKNISWQYPLVELATAILLVIAWQMVSGQSLPIEWQIGYMAFYTLMIAALMVIFVYDLYHYIIPDEVVWPAIILAGAYGLLVAGVLSHSPGEAARNLALGGIIGAGIPALISVPSGGKWMGYGDIKLGALVGLLLGFPVAVMGIFAAFVLGGLVGVILLAGKKKGLKSMVPFGPFLVTGAIIGLFYGREIIDWYLNLFLGY